MYVQLAKDRYFAWHEGESELENELEIEENEVQSLMHQMNVDDIAASDYNNIDTRIEVADMIDELLQCRKHQRKKTGKRKGKKNP